MEIVIFILIIFVLLLYVFNLKDRLEALERRVGELLSQGGEEGVEEPFELITPEKVSATKRKFLKYADKEQKKHLKKYLLKIKMELLESDNTFSLTLLSIEKWIKEKELGYLKDKIDRPSS